MTVPFLTDSSLEVFKEQKHTNAADQRKSKTAPPSNSEIVHIHPHGARGEEEAPKTNSLSLLWKQGLYSFGCSRTLYVGQASQYSV